MVDGIQTTLTLYLSNGFPDLHLCFSVLNRSVPTNSSFVDYNVASFAPIRGYNSEHWLMWFVEKKKIFMLSFFLSLMAIWQLSSNHRIWGSFLEERHVLGIVLSAICISRSVNWLAGSFANMTTSSISLERHKVWKDNLLVLLKFHVLGAASSSTVLVSITGKWSLPHRSSCVCVCVCARAYMHVLRIVSTGKILCFINTTNYYYYFPLVV